MDERNAKESINVEYEGLVKMNLALRNVYALARMRKKAGNDPWGDWGSVIRWCEEAGLSPSLLRSEA